MAGLLTAEQVAAEWQCSADHVRRLCRTRQLTAMRLGEHWRISREAVDAYRANHTTTAEVAPASGGGSGYRAAQASAARPAVDLDGEYALIVPGNVPWRLTVIDDAASPAARRGVSATTRKRA